MQDKANLQEEEINKETVDSIQEEQTDKNTEAVNGDANEEAAEMEKPEAANTEDAAQKKIAELEQQLEEKENRYLRLLADYDNFRRRTKLEREADEKYRAQQLITNLLAPIDNFERAMQIEPENEQTKALLEGVKMVYRDILKALESEGAKQIEAVGKEFDPNLHQAVMQSEEDDVGENIVVEEFQKGYILKDRVIRPSMVKVNK